MYCPSCGVQTADGDIFCGSCGADLRAEQTTPAEDAPPAESTQPSGPAPGQPSAPAASPTQPLPTQVAPTQQMPQTPVPPAQGGYAPQAPYPPQYGAAPGYGYQAPPAPKKSSALKFVVIIGAVVLLLAAVAGAAIFFMSRDGDEPPAQTPVAQPGSGDTTAAPPAGGPEFSTPEDALLSELPEDWVYTLINEDPDQVEFWGGPPQSEYVTVYLVERAADGGWMVADAFPIEMSDVPLSEEEEAQYVVEEFLYAIMDDRPEDAQALTIEPFSNDPASASYSNGEFTGFTIDGVEPKGDGTYWVLTSEDWYGNTDLYKYRVVPTEAGWRIRNLAIR